MENQEFTPTTMPNGKKRDITTVAISRNSMDKLGLICASLSIDKKEFLEKSIDYFSKSGDDPRDPIKDNLLGKLSKIENRIIGFIKTQDNEYLKVLLEDTKTAQTRLSKQKEEISESIRLNGKNTEGYILELGKAVISKQKEYISPLSEQVKQLLDEKSEIKRLRTKIEEVIIFIEANTKKSTIGGGLSVQQAEIIGTHLKALT